MKTSTSQIMNQAYVSKHLVDPKMAQQLTEDIESTSGARQLESWKGNAEAVATFAHNAIALRIEDQFETMARAAVQKKPTGHESVVTGLSSKQYFKTILEGTRWFYLACRLRRSCGKSYSGKT